MHKAYLACPDYDTHMQAIRQFCAAHPKVRVTILLYEEVARAIGIKRFANFCKECGIQDVNTGEVFSSELKDTLARADVAIAGFIDYRLKKESCEEVMRTNGFIYVQAFPTAGQKLLPGIETPAQLIMHIRAAGVQNPIYCGGGIRSVEDAKIIKAAGADGLFLGSAIIQLYDKPVEMIETIRQYQTSLAE